MPRRLLHLFIVFLTIAAPLSCISSAAESKKTAPGKTAAKPSPPAPKKAPRPAPVKKTTLAREPYLGAIVVDAADGRVLMEDNADARGYPASVLKLMLLLVSMEQIQQGRLTLKDIVPVSANAVGKEGATLKLKEGEEFTVEDMLYASMMHSANDVAVALAEKLGGGSVAGYLKLINQRAKELGMANSVFHSANGLGPEKPEDPYDITTPRDLSLLCRELLKHPDALRFTAARQRVFRPDGGQRRIPMATHNYILDEVKGCDGLKTGYIYAAGYCIAGTAQRQGKRVIAILLGATSEKSRNKLAASLIEKGFKALNSAPSEK